MTFPDFMPLFVLGAAILPLLVGSSRRDDDE